MKKRKIISVLLAAVLIIALSGTATAAFTDVPTDYKYKTEIDFSQTKGFITGTSATTFDPAGELTRGQLAVIWCRLLLLHEKNAGFTDIGALRNYYDTAAIVMNSLGVLSGTSPTTFSPDAKITREQLAVITMRTFDLGVKDPDDYTTYLDSTLISSWARDAVSACVNAKVFEGLYDGQNLYPQLPVTRGEICKLLYTVSLPPHVVTIGQLTNGTISALPNTAREGMVIHLIIRPDAGYQLKKDSLTYNGEPVSGTTFIMPPSDVTVKAEFEKVTLSSISVTSNPTKMSYTVGETLDLTGMTVTATYSDGSADDVTDKVTTDPAAGAALNDTGSIPVTVSYTEGGATQTATFSVTVSAGSGQ
jgi:hypothetical protein